MTERCPTCGLVGRYITHEEEPHKPETYVGLYKCRRDHLFLVFQEGDPEPFSIAEAAEALHQAEITRLEKLADEAF